MLKRLATAATVAVMAAPPAHAMPIVGSQGLSPNAWALVSYIQNTYPGVQSIGGVRADPLPDHPSGHALDLMIGSNMGLGDAIYADLTSHMAAHGIKYCLWRVANHFNHVHCTVL